MSTVARCDLVLSAYPASGAVLAPDGSGAEFLLGGWTSSPAREGVQLREPLGSLGFDVPERWDGPAAQGGAGRGGGRRPRGPREQRARRGQPTGSGWVVDVPAETVAAMGEGRLVVTVAQPAGEPLVLTGVSFQPR